MIVAFEGLNGVGKTTLAVAVALEVEGTYVATPDVHAKDVKHLFEVEPFAIASLLFYWSFVVRVSDVAQKDQNRIYVCDRYEWSTRSYFAAGGTDISWLVDTAPVTAADLVVVVSVAQEERMVRLSGRDRLRHVDELSLSPQFSASVEKSLDAVPNRLSIYGDRPIAENVSAVVFELKDRGLL